MTHCSTPSAWSCWKSVWQWAWAALFPTGYASPCPGIVLNGYTVIAGLGGRAITRASLRRLFEDAERDELEQVTFLDLNADVVSHELERESKMRRPGPTAEAILRRIGTVASRIG